MEVNRRRVLGTVGAAVAGAVGAGTVRSFTGGWLGRDAASESLAAMSQQPTGPTLPNGARTVFPGSRLIGWCGRPGGTVLGRMTGNLDSARNGLHRQITKYHDSDRPILPVVELIATLTHPEAGADGMFRSRCGDALIRAYLEQARKIKGLLLLNIQPGRAPILGEVMAYERWLTEPDIGVALDPEWAMGPGQIPGHQYGSTTGTVLDSVSRYLDGLVNAHHLPQKVMVYHQVAASVVTDEAALRPRAGVVPIKSVDGIGPPSLKLGTWYKLMDAKPAHVIPGFKLFYDEDTETGGPLMTPAQVLALRPAPGYVMYE